MILPTGRKFKLRVKEGAELFLQVGKAPRIDGEIGKRMRVGCGSASMGLFGRYFLDAADEVVVIDAHLIGQFTEHAAGRELGARYSGIRLRARRSTPGRYFGEHGHGWGGTSIEDPLAIIEGYDPADHEARDDGPHHRDDGRAVRPCFDWKRTGHLSPSI